jgi:hypothetical protein
VVLVRAYLGGAVRFEGRVGLERDAHVVLHVWARCELPDLQCLELGGVNLGGGTRGLKGVLVSQSIYFRGTNESVHLSPWY